MNSLELKIPPLIVMLLFAALMWFTRPYFPSTPIDISYLFYGFIFFVVIGVIIILVGALAFRKAQTTVNPTKPESSSSLVNLGIYQRTRNPMYLGMAFILIGWACYLNSPLSLMFVAAFVLYINQFQIKPEERALTTLFKQEYLDYCSKVNRWL